MKAKEVSTRNGNKKDISGRNLIAFTSKLTRRGLPKVMLHADHELAASFMQYIWQ